ncbi:hypothetical protein ACFFUO_01975 [Vibrio artabrorum]|uniref:Uncharacterized protein n=2 Tax=Vibrio TaxID=662 RepID=A0ABT8CLY6_9VIBR|nr:MULTISPECIES: hypothetical protein [Vibrio]MDC5862711.1 hypothetical protein [Vibrio europaeus]MDC5864318.1 hypothetical protein [Vibrio europaeus]MDC5864438.1 hypothetical protein [Vibrio europaeus]MDC5865025.1 hypothetical protein [Vibrio europaeus]MDN3701892.1 hypothetical protein [Vibrio artabrorum]
MPNNFPQENSVNSPLLVTIDGKSIEILTPYNPNHSDIDQYVPSTDFRKKVHKDVESLAGNLNGFFSLYNHWIKGHTKCDYTVVMEMTMRSNLISSQFNTISKACKNDRSLPESQPLTITEQVELIGLSEELGVSPSEVINLMKKHLQKAM